MEEHSRRRRLRFCPLVSCRTPTAKLHQKTGQGSGDTVGRSACRAQSRQDVPCEPWGRAALGREQGTDRTRGPYLVTVARSPQPNLQRRLQTAPSSVSARAPKSPKSLHTHAGTHSHAALTHTQHLHNSHTLTRARAHTHARAHTA